VESGLITGHGSGNYFKIGKEKFIITAGHVIGDSAVFFIEDNNEAVFLEVVYIDPYYDIAILVPHRELIDIKATNYKINKKLDILGTTVNYTGYPADLPKVMLSGTISHSGISYAIMHSYAVPGSSGSVVFDNAGRVIGVLNAVKVGMYGLSPFPTLEEDIVFIERLFMFDRKSIKEILGLWRELRN
tara:strand:+ start:2303 stop:2863 length:561 start_codon:yes stop_codon:yes gene_type:complete